MDHSVKNKQDKKFAKDLLNPSARFEPFRQNNSIEALSLMNGLEDVARQSVRDEAQAQEKARPAPKPAPAQPQAPKVTYKTDNPQYKAALKDEALVQALLDLKNKPNAKRFPPIK